MKKKAFPDRRERRSDELHLALRYQLETSRASAALDALVLADEEGLVIASSGDEGLCEELGAFAPFACRARIKMPLPTSLEEGDISYEMVKVHGQQLFLAGLGGNVAREAHLTRSREGVERILSVN